MGYRADTDIFPSSAIAQFYGKEFNRLAVTNNGYLGVDSGRRSPNRNQIEIYYSQQ